MKPALPSLFLLASAPALAQTYVESKVPLKGNNALLYHTFDNAGAAYQKVAQSLLGAGFGLAKTDKDLGYIATEARKTSRLNVLYTCKFAIKPTAMGADVLVTGNFRVPDLGDEQPITYRGMASSPFMVAWQAMQQAATAAYPTVAPIYLLLAP